jgi:hypothetical protein
VAALHDIPVQHGFSAHEAPCTAHVVPLSVPASGWLPGPTGQLHEGPKMLTASASATISV